MTFPPPRADAALVAALRETLDRAGFDRRVTRAVASAGPRPEPAALERSIAGLDPACATLARLFVIGTVVSEAVADSALAPLGCRGAARLGILRREGTGWRATLRIVPHDVLRLASDLPSWAAQPDHVAPSHAPSLTLANLTVRRPVGSALDIGTGNGIQALLLARHADHVVATDLNERALRFAELNAALDGATNIETRAGSFLEPVSGERFDVITCNPPYVITPENRLLYRDAGIRGDRLSEQLVLEIPGLLADGGFASILVSWVPTSDDPLAVPLSWAAAAGHPAWVFHFHTETVRDVAEWWLADGGAGELQRWLDWYRAERIDRIAYGAVVIQRRRRAPWRDGVELPDGPLGPAGEHLERLFAARDVLAEAPLATRRLAPAPDIETVPSADGLRLRMRDGLGLQAELGPEAAALIAQLGPKRTVAAALEATALGTEDGEDLVSRLTECGFLVPASAARPAG